jgi:hypothetical protein
MFGFQPHNLSFGRACAHASLDLGESVLRGASFLRFAALLGK